MIGIVNYGMGNLRSVQKALQLLGAEAAIVNHPADIMACEKLILPGIGAFADAISNLTELDLVDTLKQFINEGNPILGICLGMQLFFDTSCEDGHHIGLGVLPGSVERFAPSDTSLKVPHMGWNTLTPRQNNNPLFEGVPAGSHVYFVHSYYCRPLDEGTSAAMTDYDGPFCSAAHKDNVYATQFHPEKSQQVGLKILDNFARL